MCYSLLPSLFVLNGCLYCDLLWQLQLWLQIYKEKRLIFSYDQSLDITELHIQVWCSAIKLFPIAYSQPPIFLHNPHPSEFRLSKPGQEILNYLLGKSGKVGLDRKGKRVKQKDIRR